MNEFIGHHPFIKDNYNMPKRTLYERLSGSQLAETLMSVGHTMLKGAEVAVEKSKEAWSHYHTDDRPDATILSLTDAQERKRIGRPDICPDLIELDPVAQDPV
jgi:hypothetical protein